jgi:hypothetical protein
MTNKRSLKVVSLQFRCPWLWPCERKYLLSSPVLSTHYLIWHAEINKDVLKCCPESKQHTYSHTAQSKILARISHNGNYLTPCTTRVSKRIQLKTASERTSVLPQVQTKRRTNNSENGDQPWKWTSCSDNLIMCRGRAGKFSTTLKHQAMNYKISFLYARHRKQALCCQLRAQTGLPQENALDTH